MNNLDELKGIWNSASLPVPPVEQIRKMVFSFKSLRLKRKRKMIIMSIMLTILMILVLINTNFGMWSSYLGGSIVACCAIFVAVSNVRSYGRFQGIEALSMLEFLGFLEQTHTNLLNFYYRTQPWVFALLIIGLSLYMLEALLINFWAGIALYFFSLSGLLVCWFYLRPKYFKRNIAAIQAEKERLRMLLEEFNDGDKQS